MKYTAKQVREERICFENLTEEQFIKLKFHFQKLYPNSNYTKGEYDKGAISFRFYPFRKGASNVIGSLASQSYTAIQKVNEFRASKAITFDQFDFEETSDSFPEKWFMKLTKENIDMAMEWQHEKTKHNRAKLDHGDVGCLLLSEHEYDGSYYYSRGSLDREFYHDYKEITTEQFKQHVLKQSTTTMTKTQTITREALESIYDVACSGWKDKLESWVSDQGLFKKEYKLTSEQVEEMFKASDYVQTKVLLKAGLTKPGFVLDLSEETIVTPNGKKYHNPLSKTEGIESLISLRCGSSGYTNKSYYLNYDFDWTIENDNGISVLVPKLKN